MRISANGKNRFAKLVRYADSQFQDFGFSHAGLETPTEPPKMILPQRRKGAKKGFLFVSWCLCGSLF
jgi:hypothetical protein